MKIWTRQFVQLKLLNDLASLISIAFNFKDKHKNGMYCVFAIGIKIKFDDEY